MADYYGYSTACASHPCQSAQKHSQCFWLQCKKCHLKRLVNHSITIFGNGNVNRRAGVEHIFHRRRILKQHLAFGGEKQAVILLNKVQCFGGKFCDFLFMSRKYNGLHTQRGAVSASDGRLDISSSHAARTACSLRHARCGRRKPI